MRIPGLKSAKRAGVWLRSRVVKHALILGYHRIAVTDNDPYNLFVSLRNFFEQLEVLRRYSRVVNLNELVEGIQNGNLPDKTVVITFDDGYVDILQNAKPLLERSQIPATVFVPTVYIGRRPWWDELKMLYSSSKSYQDKINKILADVPSDTGDKKPQSAVAREARKNAVKQPIIAVYERLRDASPQVREHALFQLEHLAAEESRSRETTDRVMTGDELVELSSNGLIDIGSHSVSHPWLSELTEEYQRSEILNSKSCLEKITGKTVNSFSYPNGSYSSFTVTLLKEGGYKCACTSTNIIVREGSDLFQLPRFWVPNWDGATFERWLMKWI